MVKDVLNYYGIDWLAMILTFLSIYFLGAKKKKGFVFGLLANFSWFTFGIMAHSVANLIANVVFAAMNIKGYVAWSSKKERQNSIETATFERSKS